MAARVKPNGLLGLNRGRRASEAGHNAAMVDMAVGTTNVPEHILALSSVPDAEYADVFTLATDVAATPEQWARAMFGDVPSAAEHLIWRGLLGMRLSRGRSPDTIAGWQIAERGATCVRLEAGSWFLTGNLVVLATTEGLSLATFVRYDRTLGRLVWPPLSVVHRRLAPGLLRDAVKTRTSRQKRQIPSRDLAAPGPRAFGEMKLDDVAHTSHPWRIHHMVDDFDLADVWALPTPGGPDDLPRLARLIAATDESFLSNPLVRLLFSVRMKLGAWLGWDTAPDGTNARVWSLRDRLPSDLRNGPRGPDVITLVPFPSVYLTDTEWVAECSSRSVHMVQHVGWVPDGSGGYRGQLATLVRPTSRFGRLYLRAIEPFRRYLVSPAQVRSIARDWEKEMTSQN